MPAIFLDDTFSLDDIRINDDLFISCKVSRGSFNTEHAMIYEFTINSDNSNLPSHCTYYDVSTFLSKSYLINTFNAVNEKFLKDLFLAWLDYWRTANALQKDALQATSCDLAFDAHGASSLLTEKVNNLARVSRSLRSGKS